MEPNTRVLLKAERLRKPIGRCVREADVEALNPEDLAERLASLFAQNLDAGDKAERL
jgi:hypothetical protein